MIDRDDLGFLLAKAAQRWNELLAERFAAAGYEDISPSYGSVLVPLFEEDGTTVLCMRAESLDWVASLLAGLGCGFTVRRPDELRASVRALAARLATA